MRLGAGLDSTENLAFHRDSIPGPSSPERIAIPTTLYRPRVVWEIKHVAHPSIHVEAVRAKINSCPKGVRLL